MSKKLLIVITGPTASGKSDLAIEIARRYGTGIISADSRQIYREIPISTAAPTPEMLEQVPHHLVGMLSVSDYYSASLFEQQALRIIESLFRKSDYAVVCGGSMMYIDALCNGIDELPTVPEDLRSRLMAETKERGYEWLLSELKRLDPEHYERVDRKNKKRVFHAVEISLAAGRPYSSLLTGRRTERPFKILKICLTAPRDILFGRINERVEQMMRQGLEREAETMLPYRRLNALNTVGLKEMFAYFDGLMDLPDAIARAQKNTRVYAKKQMTWHKRDASLHYLDITDPEYKEKAFRLIEEYSADSDSNQDK